MFWSALRWFASVEKIRSRSTYRVLHDVGEKRSKDKTDEETQYCDVSFVNAWLKDRSPNYKDK